VSNPVVHLKSCSFYADEPEELVNLQEKEWQPILQWFNKRYGIVHFIVNNNNNNNNNNLLFTLKNYKYKYNYK